MPTRFYPAIAHQIQRILYNALPHCLSVCHSDTVITVITRLWQWRECKRMHVLLCLNGCVSQIRLCMFPVFNGWRWSWRWWSMWQISEAWGSSRFQWQVAGCLVWNGKSDDVIQNGSFKLRIKSFRYLEVLQSGSKKRSCHICGNQ